VLASRGEAKFHTWATVLHMMYFSPQHAIPAPVKTSKIAVFRLLKHSSIPVRAPKSVDECFDSGGMTAPIPPVPVSTTVLYLCISSDYFLTSNWSYLDFTFLVFGTLFCFLCSLRPLLTKNELHKYTTLNRSSLACHLDE
jgi:hypothetical protein